MKLVRNQPAPATILEHGVGEAPEGLTQDEADVWYTLKADWPNLRPTHRETLRLYCKVAVEVEEVRKIIADSGEVIVTGQGQAVLSPWTKRETELRKQAQALLFALVKGATEK